MLDCGVSREAESAACEQVAWSKDGDVSLIFRNDLVLLKPKNVGKPAAADSASSLSEIYTISRLAGSLLQWENPLSSVLCDGEVIRVGQAQKHAQALQNLNNPVEFRWSESGVSDRNGCMAVLVSDSLCGYLVECEGSNLAVVAVLNEHICKDEAIDLERIVTMPQLAQIRVHSVGWFGSVDYKSLKPPVWPIWRSSLLVVFTEASKTWIYRVDEGKKLVPETSFESGFEVSKEGDEYVRKCAVSDWIGSSSYIAMVTSKNRVVVRMFNGKSVDVEEGIEVPVEGLVSVLKFTKVQGTDGKPPLALPLLLLTIVSTDSVQFIYLDGKGKKPVQSVGSTLFGTRVLCNSVAQWTVGTTVHTVVSNIQKDLVHLKQSIGGPVSGKRYNYRKKVDEKDASELPLLQKLNELNELNDSGTTFRLLGIGSNPSGQFLGVSTSLFDPTQPIDGRIVSHREGVAFSVVPTHEQVSLDVLDDLALFNTVQTAPQLRIQSSRLVVKAPDLADPADSDGPKKVSDTVTATSFNRHESPVASLQENLVLSEQSERVRLANALAVGGPAVGGPAVSGPPVDRSNLQLLAKIVVELVRTGSIKLESDYDKLMCQQYQRLLGLASPTVTGVARIRIPRTEFVETFKLGVRVSSGSGPDPSLLETITSEEGHTWRVCELTLLPLVDPGVRRCSCCSCLVRPIDPETAGGAVGLVLGSLPQCIYCGGRYTKRV